MKKFILWVLKWVGISLWGWLVLTLAFTASMELVFNIPSLNAAINNPDKD